MNKSAIEWCTHTWNPMTGCLHGCPYCYAAQIARRFSGSKAWPVGFDPLFRPKRLDEPAALKKQAIIFAGSMTDIFGNWWKSDYIMRVMDTIAANKNHRFVVLTKNPARMVEILNHFTPDKFPHTYFGTSVTGAAPESDFHTESRRLTDLREVSLDGFNTVISFEPLHHYPDKLIEETPGHISWVNWVIIGYQTNPEKIPPSQSKCYIRDAIADHDIPFFIKDNSCPKRCEHLLTRRKYPGDLLQIAYSWGKV